MHPNTQLTPEENAAVEAQLRLATHEATVIEQLGLLLDDDASLFDPSVSDGCDVHERQARSDAAPRTTVGKYLLPHYTFKDTSKMTDGEVDAAITECLMTMESLGFGIDQPQIVPPREFYAWLESDFMNHEMSILLGGGWFSGFIYDELVPDGPDAVNSWVEQFIDYLFERKTYSEPNAHVDSAYDKETTASYLPESLENYIRAWRGGFRSLEEFEYVPLSVTYHDDRHDQGTFYFTLSYTVTREDGRLETLSGPGEAQIVKAYGFPAIEGISFAGFALGRG